MSMHRTLEEVDRVFRYVDAELRNEVNIQQQRTASPTNPTSRDHLRRVDEAEKNIAKLKVARDALALAFDALRKTA